jgi:hypothetical protein
MDDEDRKGWVTPGRNAVDEALGLTEDPRPQPDDANETAEPAAGTDSDDRR